MSDTVTTTFYLDRNGEIAQHVLGRDTNGAVFLESGIECQDPSRVLDGEGIARIMRQRVLAAEQEHSESQTRAAAAAKAAATAHEERATTLRDAGLPEAAITVILGPPPSPYKPTEFRAVGADENLRSYGLDDEQIRRVLSGWV